MTKNTIIKPLEEELPSQFAERLAIEYSSRVRGIHKKELGQFFTPHPIAKFMASLYEVKNVNPRVRILDPGCGIGILSTTLIERLVSLNKNIFIIDLVVFEVDANIIDLTEKCFDYLRRWLGEKGIELKFFLCKNDFILHNTRVLNNHPTEEIYDIIISNPPYFKLPKNDERNKAARLIIHGQSNIYTIFLVIAAKLLANNGKMIFITPRSFCSGSYSRLFREVFFSLVNINLLHIFDSRKAAFKKDKVLQENIILLASKKNISELNQFELPLIGKEKIVVSSSKGIVDLSSSEKNIYNWDELINVNSYQKILHVPVSKIDKQVIDIFKSWTGSLSQYGLKISTGPLVDFRNADKISTKKKKSMVPLFWMHNVDCMSVNWPKSQYKSKEKGQYVCSDKVKLLNNRNYVFIRRFSTKDDKKRLIAAPYFANNFNYPVIGIENHLNYIYKCNGELSEVEILGLSSLLNSKLFDVYFRTFNGNINVSATELMDFPLPKFDLIELLGKEQINRKSNIENIDFLISKIFDLKIDLSHYG